VTPTAEGPVLQGRISATAAQALSPAAQAQARPEALPGMEPSRAAEVFRLELGGQEASGWRGLRKMGLGLAHAQNWSPVTDRVSWSQLSLVWLFDRDPLFPYRPAPSLRWVAELDLGLTEQPENKAVMAAGMHALWSPWKPEGWHPFISGGIGGVYTDWQVQGQSLRVNFNPQVGLGAEFDGRWLLTVRVHHLSNAGLVSPNTGVNSVLALLAVYL
jgi:hypothetical protein